MYGGCDEVSSLFCWLLCGNVGNLLLLTMGGKKKAGIYV